MKFFLFLALLAIVGMLAFHQYQEMHPEKKKDLFNYSLKEEEGEGPKTTPAVYRILGVDKPDTFQVLRDNTETQTFHLVGLIAPNEKGEDLFSCQKSPEQLKSIYQEAKAYSEETLLPNLGLHVKERMRQHRDGVLFVEGDVVLSNGSSFASSLVSKGYAMGEEKSVVDYTQYENDARQNERGLWMNAVPVSQRFIVSYTIKQESLGRDSHQQKASMTHEVLEEVASEERTVVADVRIKLTTPLTRTYDVAAVCSFTMEEIKGVSDEEGESRSMVGVENKVERLTLCTPTTNFTVRSSPFEMSKIKRGGRVFRQGNYCSFCQLTVTADGESIAKDNRIF